MQNHRETYSFLSAGHVVFGNHAVLQLGDLIAKKDLQRVLIVTDKNLIQLGLVETVRSSLSECGIQVHLFEGCEPEPTSEAIYRCIKVARQFNPDAVLGLGGGSNMDTAKLTTIVLTHGGELKNYIGEEKVPGVLKPLICVPTTAGTGSEVSQAAVFTDTDRGVKVSVLSQFIRPWLAVIDPKLTLSCPKTITADCGMDALTHAIEAFTAINYSDYPLPIGEKSVYQGKNPIADLFARKTIELVGKYLLRAFENGGDLEAREAMALAGTLGGMAFSNAGVALVHAMEYPLGAAVHCSHGRGNGLLLPYVMRYNLDFAKSALAEIAILLDVQPLPDTLEDRALKAIQTVEELRNAVGIPTRLRDLGAQENQLSHFAEKAFSISRLMRVNPRYPTLEEIESIYRNAF